MIDFTRPGRSDFLCQRYTDLLQPILKRRIQKITGEKLLMRQ